MQRGGSAGVLYPTLGGGGVDGGGYQGQGKTPKKYWRDKAGDEEMWMVQARREESDGGKMKGEK